MFCRSGLQQIALEFNFILNVAKAKKECVDSLHERKHDLKTFRLQE